MPTPPPDGSSISPILNIAISAISGAGTGALSVFLVGPAKERDRIWSLSNGIVLRNFEPAGTGHYRIWVRNTGTETIEEAIGYLDLNNRAADIVDALPAVERIGHRTPVTDGRLCWAIDGNPHKIDIFPGEAQLLNFAQYVGFNSTGGSPQHALVIASESGFGESSQRLARVCLAPKRYDGILRIVARNILSRTYRVEIVVSQSVFGSPHEPIPEAYIRKWPFVLFNCRRVSQYA